jgi:hypothetical protein
MSGVFRTGSIPAEKSTTPAPPWQGGEFEICIMTAFFTSDSLVSILHSESDGAAPVTGI